jgi:hypothetical protein
VSLERWKKPGAGYSTNVKIAKYVTKKSTTV